MPGPMIAAVTERGQSNRPMLTNPVENSCDVGPVNNLRALRYLKRSMAQEQAAIDT